MRIEQIYTSCLAEAAYYVSSNGEAFVVDPMRDLDEILAFAKEDNAKIKYVFETHFHADFVSGHIDLAANMGAEIVYGPTEMETGFDKIVAKDQQVFEVGNLKVKLIHTPGHTLESSCLLLIDENGNEKALFSGDTLFIGDVGRPDLAQKVIPDLTEEKLAKHLYHSLHHKIKALSDDLIVYPNHGKGSACGKNMSDKRWDSLGNQKKTNYALREGLTETQFVEEVLHGLMPPPGYFPQNVLINIKGYKSLDEVKNNANRALSVEAFEALSQEPDVLILDTREAEEFKKAAVPNSIFIGIDGSFASWLGTVIPSVDQKIVLIAENDRLDEVVTRMARVGYENILGYLQGGFDTWDKANKPIQQVKSISPTCVLNSENLVDVRKKSEYDSEHIEGALNLPLDYISEAYVSLNKENEYQIHCAGGYRSVVFISLLMRQGFSALVNVNKGFAGLKEDNNLKISAYQEQKTLL